MHAGSEDYVSHMVYRRSLHNGYIMVFKAVDDFSFYHQVLPCLHAQAHQYRIAFVFRWLGATRLQDFPVPQD